MKIIISCILIILICVPNTTYAMGEIISQGDKFLSVRDQVTPIDEEALKSTSDYIYNVLFVIAVVLAIAVGIIIGIQFLVGSVEEQAKVKETLVPYIVGVFVVFGSFTIWKIAVNIGNEVSPTLEATGGNAYDYVMKYSYEDIEDMSNEQRERYYDKIQEALIELDDKEKDKIKEVEERKEAVEEITDKMSGKYSLWNEYKGSQTDKQAYWNILHTDINSINTSADIEKNMKIIYNAKAYFAVYGTTEQVNELTNLYQKYVDRLDYVKKQEMSGLENEDTIEKNNRIEKNGYYAQIKEIGKFETTEQVGWYKEKSTGTNLDIDIKKGDANNFLNSMTSKNAIETTKTISKNGKNFQLKRLEYKSYVECYICYQIDNQTIYTISIDSNETDEGTLLNLIEGFLNPSIGNI